MYFVGIDLGTSAVKVLLMDETGQIIKTVSKEYPICFPKVGWAEQNPEDWYEQTILGLRELLEKKDRSMVTGIGIGGQMHGLVVLDKKDQVIRPAILWNDGRSIEECDYLNNTVGKEQLVAYTGNIAFPGFTAPKILWLKKNEPENYSKICKIMLPKDYLIYRLTGVHSTDVSDASGTLLFDVQNRCWSKEMCDICGVRITQLGICKESYEPVGILCPDVAKLLKLKEEVQVTAGAGDNAAAAIGTGIAGQGSCNISLGTSGTIFITSGHFVKDENYGLHSFAHADGTYHLMGCILSAASCNKWWMEDILKTKQYETEQENITGLGENNVYFLPYLMGERSPHNDANARGMFLGITMGTTREQMTQAVLEGVAFALRDCLEIAKKKGIVLKTTKICGGGAHSLLWKKIIANVLNLEVECVENEEGPAMGGAMLAAVACGYYESVQEISRKVVKVAEKIKPEKNLVEKYEERYRKFQFIYPSCKKLFEELGS